jgi:ATP-dependent Clp protease adaptor protein ClpS
MAEKESVSVPAESGGAAAVEKAEPSKNTKPRNQTDRLPPYNVVLLDDDHHTYEYVIEMLGKIFGYDKQKAFKLAEEVDTNGRVILLTTHKEKAELKRDQVTAYGRDFRMETSTGSMSAIVEPAEG